ncbi:MAG: histidine phosphatase family protein [Deltaproteobacteria bacterium]
MTTRLFLIRHGATTLSAEDRFAGSVDVELSEAGRAQVVSLAERLATEKLAAVYASPMKRTMATAQLVGAPHGLSPIAMPALREIDHGRWEGLTRGEVESRFADEYQQWEEDPFTYAPQSGESGLSMLARAFPAIREIVSTHPGANVAIVSHKATLRLLLCAVLGIDARGYRDCLDQSPACLNVLDFKDAVRARLMLFNDVSHYAEWPQRASKGLSKWWDGERG